MSELRFRGPLLPFDRDEPEFVYGFEAGSIWALLQGNPDETIEEYIHACNIEMALRMGEATGREVKSQELGDDWFLVIFSPVKPAQEEISNLQNQA